jgi:hypothetical protein
MIHPGGLQDLPLLSDQYVASLEARFPRLQEASRHLRYLRNPAHVGDIRRRNRRRMRVMLPPLEEALPAAYRTAFWAAYNENNVEDEDPAPLTLVPHYVFYAG